MFTLNCGGKMLVIERPLVMAIINVTPDSFFVSGRANNAEEILQRTDKLIAEGADIIDVGGQSTRPGSKRISVQEEMKRVLPAIEIIMDKYPEAIISVDTYQSQVAREAVAAGARMVNDVSAGNIDAAMLPTVGRLNVPYICMHMKGTPESMQEKPVYENVAREVLDFFIRKIAEFRSEGIEDVIIDPGFGFGKTIAHNFVLLKHLSFFKMLDKPILAGLSRKSTVYKTIGKTAEEALNGSTVLHTLALQNGANILRVHDVKEAKEAVLLVEKYCDA